MSITANVITVADIPTEGEEWAINLYSASVTGCEELKAAVTGKYIYLKKIVITCADNVAVTVGAGETTNAVTTILLGPYSFATTKDVGSPSTERDYIPIGHVELDFRPRAVKLPVSTALAIDSTGPAPINIYIEGKTCSS